MSSICATCKQIPFPVLGCPTASNIIRAHEMRRNGQRYRTFLPFDGSALPPGTWKNPSDVADTFELGPLYRIRERATVGNCKLCDLIYRLIQRRGALYANKTPIPENDDNVVFMASLSFYAAIMENPGGDVLIDELIFLRRLRLYVTLKADAQINGLQKIAGWNLSTYMNIAQPCHVDDFNSGTEEPRLLFSARKRPDVVDIGLLKKWISICQTEHELSCFPDNDDVPLGHSAINNRVPLIRFIDVEQNCISVLRNVDLAKTPYLALSYCWGLDQKVKLNAGNSETFQQKDSLPNDLPRTIQDAIRLTGLLGFTYIWVDVLCIFQGETEADKTDRSAQLQKMGTIYRESNVTIVAACGPTAEAGLSGLWPGSRTFKQEIIQVVSPEEDPVHGGLALVSSCFSDPPWTVFHPNHQSWGEALESSDWNSRAWTFQERTLSRRCLTFTPEQVQWFCDGATFCEESHFEPPKLYEPGMFELPLHIQYFHTNSIMSYKSIDGPLGQLTTNQRVLWTKFGGVVAAYTRRNMSYRGDVYDAFKGVLEAFTNISGEQFHWGHPRSRFELSLMWNPPSYVYDLYRRTEETTLPMTYLNKHVRLPSWSWMGWVGAVSVIIGDRRMETETPEISCYEHTLSPFRLVRIKGTNKFDKVHTLDFEKPLAPKPQPPWKPSGSDEQVTPATIRTHLPALTESYLATQPPGHILFFWASSVFLAVQRPSDYSLSNNIISSPTHSEVDGIVLSATTAKDYDEGDSNTPQEQTREQVGTVDAMSLEHWQQTPGPAGLHEFIAIGRRVVEDVPGVEPMVLALQIRWITEDADRSGRQTTTVAERVNFGQIKERAWMEAAPTWKLIALR